VTLPVPNLDDRRFQDLVDDSKRYVQSRCPEWSDHNVSDPGVTLIETFAMVADQILYRLNRVPDRLYVRFLELLGIDLVPPAPARTDVTFWLAAPRRDTVVVRTGVEVATVRTEFDAPVVFETAEDLDILPCTLAAVASATAAGQVVDRSAQLADDGVFACFGGPPRVGDALLIGLSGAVPRCVVTVRVNCRAEGAGVDPRNPPWVWEAWTGRRWSPCELDPGADGTGGFNRPGAIVLHLPVDHAESVIGGRRAGWLRCRLVAPDEGQPFYEQSPRILGASVFTVGGTIPALHAETVREEMLGLSDGVPGQSFPLARGPVLGQDAALVVEVAGGVEDHGWRRWKRVEHFDGSSPTDRHFRLDTATGAITFGPGVRQRDGTVRQFGAVPPKAAPIRASLYRIGGGRQGNVAARTITTLRTSVPFVTSEVGNRRPATGGVDGEDLESAKSRAPAFLRTRQRAVTTADYEYLARAADPRAARTRCIAGSGDEAAVIRLALVPVITGDPGGPAPIEAFLPNAELLERITAYLDERRMLGTRLIVEPPFYERITVLARVRLDPRADTERVHARASEVAYRYLHPLVGGPEGKGWPFGRTVAAGEVLSRLAQLSGVEQVEEVRLYRYDPRTGSRAEGWTTRVELGRGALPFSVAHEIEIMGPR
jgi:predicted phage baseplate assembly protein